MGLIVFAETTPPVPLGSRMALVKGAVEPALFTLCRFANSMSLLWHPTSPVVDAHVIETAWAGTIVMSANNAAIATWIRIVW